MGGAIKIHQEQLVVVVPQFLHHGEIVRLSFLIV